MLKANKTAGIILLLLGIICITYPFAAATAVNIVVGCSLLVGSLFSLTGFPKHGDFWDKALYVILALVYGIAGLYMILNPVIGIIAITLVLGVNFLIQGLYTLYYWTRIKSSKGASVLAFVSAQVSIILGVILLSNISAGPWFIGVITGINLIFTGASIFALESPKKYVEMG